MNRLKQLTITVLSLALSMAWAETQIRNIAEIGPNTESIESNGYAQIYYVSSAASEDGDGSQTSPWKSLTAGMSGLPEASADRPLAVFVSEGNYGGETLMMRPFVDLFGGFDSVTWDRDIHVYRSVLDGEGERRVVFAANDCILDGFTITRGRTSTHGGGILCDDASPTIKNCFITENTTLEPENFNHTRIHQDAHHGGGIAVFFNSAPVIRNNVFFNNRTHIGNGAGVAFYGWIRIKGAPETSFESNVMVGGLQAQLKNNVFVNNVAGVTDTNRTRSSNGGAISCAFEARPVIENNVIAYNEAKGRGDAGGIYSEYYSYPTVVSNWLLGNIGDDDGGAIYAMRMGHITISQNFIAGNWTRGNGVGGIRLSKEGRGLIRDNIIVQNQTGGALQCVDSYVEYRNNLVMHNKGKASIKYVNHFPYFQPSIAENNIIRENEGGLSIDATEGATLKLIKNNIDAKVKGKRNKNRSITLIDDARILKSTSLIFDESRYQSILEIDAAADISSLVGRIAHINEFWSVICAVEGNKIYTWGDAQAQYTAGDDIEIISDYKFK